MRKVILIILFGLILLSCEKESDIQTTTLDFNEFSINIPIIWIYQPNQGYDSFVGGIEIHARREAPPLDAQRRAAAHDVLHIGPAADVPALGRFGRAVEVELVKRVGCYVGKRLLRDAGRVRAQPDGLNGVARAPH